MNENPTNNLPADEFWERVAADPKVRREVTRGSFPVFFEIHYRRPDHYPIAPFHKEIMAALEDERHRFILLESFRGSAKTTIANQAYALWSILGKQEKKNVLILAQTQGQVRYYLGNIKRKMSEELLRKDLGPFYDGSGEWRWNTIEIPKYKARLTVASVDQPIRGLLYEDRRPDLVIGDDLEDESSVRSLEMRDKLYSWFTMDVLPLGDKNTRTIVIGTRLHEDSLMMRLRSDIKENRRDGLILSYPLLDEDGKSMWPGKFPNKEAVDAERKRIGDEIAFRQEYLLDLVPEGSQIIQKDWIKTYSQMPERGSTYALTITSADLALGGKKGDFTAIVSADVHINENWEAEIYIHPNPVNDRIEYPDFLDCISLLSKSLGKGWPILLVIEDVAFQRAAVQELEKRGFAVRAFRPGKMDKRTRLTLTTGLVKSGRVLFPEHGAEELIRQLVNFPNIKYMDLVDAFSMLVLQTMMEVQEGPQEVIWL